MYSSNIIVKDLVLVGGGHTHLYVLKAFGMKPLDGLRITLISRERMAPYSGMLPGLIAGHYQFDDAHVDLLPLARFSGARFLHDEVTGLDTKRQQVLFRDRPPLHYDLLSLDIGSSPAPAPDRISRERVIPVKPIDSFISRWENCMHRILQRANGSHIGVVGAGAAGVELILAIQHRLKTELGKEGIQTPALSFSLFSESGTILPAFNSKLGKRFHNILKQRNIHVHTNCRISGGDTETLNCDDGRSFQLDEIFWATNASAQSWLSDSGLALNEMGFINVKDTLESVSHDNIFAAGDVAHMINHPRPKSGVFAVRQGPPLFENLQRRLLKRKLKPFTPQKNHLSLISTGDRYAIASRSRWISEGKRVWQWKNWIDRRFMAKYKELPEMQKNSRNGPVLPELDEFLDKNEIATMRCGGCGGKVGASILDDVLSQLPAQDDGDIVIGLDSTDDAAAISLPENQLLVQTVDFFREFIEDPWLFGQIAAHHALNDIFAMGASASTAMAMVTLPQSEENILRSDLLQMLLGSVHVLNKANTRLIGGHTGEASDVSLGFTINGFIEEKTLLRKKGMKDKDHLILTKPLGTGLLFAAHMRGKASSASISNALNMMLQSNQHAANSLKDFQINACTDISGYGLLGHLLEMARVSEVDVTLDLSRIPILDGVSACQESGIFSSLYPENRRFERFISNVDSASVNPVFPVIFDPQTSGGLLFSLPERESSAFIGQLKSLGYSQAEIIGKVTSRSGADTTVTITD